MYVDRSITVHDGFTEVLEDSSTRDSVRKAGVVQLWQFFFLVFSFFFISFPRFARHRRVSRVRVHSPVTLVRLVRSGRMSGRSIVRPSSADRWNKQTRRPLSCALVYISRVHPRAFIHTRVRTHAHTQNTYGAPRGNTRCENIRWVWRKWAGGRIARGFAYVSFGVIIGGFCNGAGRGGKRGKIYRAGGGSIARSSMAQVSLGALSGTRPWRDAPLAADRARGRKKIWSNESEGWWRRIAVITGSRRWSRYRVRARVHPVDRPGRTLLSYRLKWLNTPELEFLFGSLFFKSVSAPYERPSTRSQR